MKRLFFVLSYIMCFLAGIAVYQWYSSRQESIMVPKYEFSTSTENIKKKRIYNAQIVSIIATQLWYDTFGTNEIKEMEPYNVIEDDSTWIVTGTNNKGEFLDGCGFVLEIDNTNGMIKRFYKER